jgi:hypothetical protein
MAEFVEYRAERMIPELEQMEHIGLFEKHEIRYWNIAIYSQCVCNVAVLWKCSMEGRFDSLEVSFLGYVRLDYFLPILIFCFIVILYSVPNIHIIHRN